MIRSFAFAVMTLMCFTLLPGCGGQEDNVVSAPPETTSVNVDAERAQEAGGSAPQNVDYTKQ
ncbi:hypothetical protein SH528x_004193 [Novipirellula sp. SH528]|uniref:hypothetical protein n=1 Tax=Novipirellula sp. SH528 TaxID=3454466 RepID=UPI003FA175EE